MATFEPREGQVKSGCPNCGGQLLRLGGSPVLAQGSRSGLVVASPVVDRLRCETCGWSKLECSACGKPLQFYAGRYSCSKCRWMGYGTTYSDDSDGAPQPGAVAKPPPKPTKCNRCGAVIQPGDLVIRHETKRKLVACAKCAAEGGFSDMLQRYG